MRRRGIALAICLWAAPAVAQWRPPPTAQGTQPTPAPSPSVRVEITGARSAADAYRVIAPIFLDPCEALGTPLAAALAEADPELLRGVAGQAQSAPLTFVVTAEGRLRVPDSVRENMPCQARRLARVSLGASDRATLTVSPSNPQSTVPGASHGFGWITVDFDVGVDQDRVRDAREAVRQCFLRHGARIDASRLAAVEVELETGPDGVAVRARTSATDLGLTVFERCVTRAIRRQRIATDPPVVRPFHATVRVMGPAENRTHRIVLSGPRSTDSELARSVRARSPALLAALAPCAPRDGPPGQTRTFQLELDLAADGSVSAARPSPATRASRCFAARVARWRVPGTGAPGTVSFAVQVD